MCLSTTKSAETRNAIVVHVSDDETTPHYSSYEEFDDGSDTNLSLSDSDDDDTLSDFSMSDIDESWWDFAKNDDDSLSDTNDEEFDSDDEEDSDDENDKENGDERPEWKKQVDRAHRRLDKMDKMMHDFEDEIARHTRELEEWLGEFNLS